MFDTLMGLLSSGEIVVVLRATIETASGAR
jgi:hypothetical protein